MDINTIRVVLLVLCFLTFVGIIWWAYGSGRQSRFEEASQLPFNEEKLLPPADVTQSDLPQKDLPYTEKNGS